MFDKTQYIHSKKPIQTESSGTLPLPLGIMQKDRSYLLTSKNSPELAIQAIMHDDQLILEILLNPIQMTLEEINAHKEFDHYLELKMRYERFKKIREHQKKILEDSYYEFGSAALKHMQAIKSQLAWNLHQLLYELRLKNRKELIEREHIIWNSQLTKLDKTMRVRLHNGFSLQLLEDFKLTQFDCEFESLDDALALYDEIKKHITWIDEKISELEANHQKVISKIDRINKQKNIVQKKYDQKKLQLINSLFTDNFLHKSSLQQITLITRMLKKDISLNYVDTATGNNFLHIACLNGKFSVGLYLLDKGIDWQKENKAGVSAIDSQDVNGDTLMHYLVKQGQFETLCELLARGASSHITNNNQQTIFDLDNNNNSLFHYLLKKINQPTYLGLLLRFVSNELLLSHLLIKNQRGETAYQVILEFPEDLKALLFDPFKKRHLAETFHSTFETDVNQTLWRHFDSLIKPPSSTWYDNLFTKNSDKSANEKTNRQWRFLSELQKKLLHSKKTHNDLHVYYFLSNPTTLKDLQDVIMKFYSSHVASVQELVLIRKHKKNTNHQTYLALPKNTSAHEISSSFHKAPQPNKSLSTPKDYKAVKACIDPLSWFSKQTPKKILKKNLITSYEGYTQKHVTFKS